jgi:hypothetical protein
LVVAVGGGVCAPAAPVSVTTMAVAAATMNGLMTVCPFALAFVVLPTERLDE